jgi:hypothetical protein
MFADLFAVIVLLNFYLHILIHYYFTASHLIYFIIVFIYRALRPPDADSHVAKGSRGDQGAIIQSDPTVGSRRARGQSGPVGGSRGAECQG